MLLRTSCANLPALAFRIKTLRTAPLTSRWTYATQLPRTAFRLNISMSKKVRRPIKNNGALSNLAPLTSTASWVVLHGCYTGRKPYVRARDQVLGEIFESRSIHTCTSIQAIGQACHAVEKLPRALDGAHSRTSPSR
eukprot:1177977-Prorocentrum_minimum.AAC.3